MVKVIKSKSIEELQRSMDFYHEHYGLLAIGSVTAFSVGSGNAPTEYIVVMQRPISS